MNTRIALRIYWVIEVAAIVGLNLVFVKHICPAHEALAQSLHAPMLIPCWSISGALSVLMLLAGIWGDRGIRSKARQRGMTPN